jgi:hypothetical protein
MAASGRRDIKFYYATMPGTEPLRGCRKEDL